MKKLLLFILSIALNFFISNAQVCTPTWSGSGDGLRPDSAQNLMTATSGVPYAETINFKIPTDSVVNGFSFPIDSFVLTQVLGLPSTITYACNPSNCSFPGGSIGCVQLSGTPVVSDTGAHPLKVIVYGWSGKVELPDTIKYYVLRVNSSTGINKLNRYNFDVAQNYPNPIENATRIDFNLPISGNIYFKVYNLFGSVLYEQLYYAKAGVNYITYDASNLSDGIYFYTMSDGINTITHRMIVNNR